MQIDSEKMANIYLIYLNHMLQMNFTEYLDRYQLYFNSMAAMFNWH